MPMGGEEPFLAFALELAEKARTISLRDFRSAASFRDMKNKSAKPSAFDPLTPTDTKIEKALRAMIEKRFPDHSIWGEEFGREGQGSFEWILDPLDGTRNFVSGALYWTHLIGLRKEGRPLLGVCDHPLTKERFFASREEGGGGGAWLQNGAEKRRMRTRRCDNLESAVLGATTPNMFQGQKERQVFEALQKKTRIQIFGGNAYSYALLAAGWMDVVIESSLTIFDVQPLLPIVEEAGGIITDWQGEAVREGGQVLACGDKALHAKILPLIKEGAQMGETRGKT